MTRRSTSFESSRSNEHTYIRQELKDLPPLRVSLSYTVRSSCLTTHTIHTGFLFTICVGQPVSRPNHHSLSRGCLFHSQTSSLPPLKECGLSLHSGCVSSWTLHGSYACFRDKTFSVFFSSWELSEWLGVLLAAAMPHGKRRFVLGIRGCTHDARLPCSR